jgi:hypothetical protein
MASAKEQLQDLMDRLDTILTISTTALENENYEPGRKDLEFFVDSALEVLDKMRGIDLEGGGL